MIFSKAEIVCKGTAFYYNVQVFWQKKISTFYKSFPKQKCIYVTIRRLLFIFDLKVSHFRKVINNAIFSVEKLYVL